MRAVEASGATGSGEQGKTPGERMQTILELQELALEAANAAPELEFASTISSVSCTWIMD
jgi:hypothetical protein